MSLPYKIGQHDADVKYTRYGIMPIDIAVNIVDPISTVSICILRFKHDLNETIKIGDWTVQWKASDGEKVNTLIFKLIVIMIG